MPCICTKTRKPNLNYRFRLQQLYVISSFMFAKFGPVHWAWLWSTFFSALARHAIAFLCVCNCACSCAAFRTSANSRQCWRVTHDDNKWQKRYHIAPCIVQMNNEWAAKVCVAKNHREYIVSRGMALHTAHKLWGITVLRSCTSSVKCHTFIYHFFESHSWAKRTQSHSRVGEIHLNVMNCLTVGDTNDEHTHVVPSEIPFVPKMVSIHSAHAARKGRKKAKKTAAVALQFKVSHSHLPWSSCDVCMTAWLI